MKSLGLVIAVVLVVNAISVKAETCSWENCPEWKSDMLNVHLICHTHDDSGWLKTVDQYFWGSNQSISNAGVQYILDSVVTELQKDPKRRFSYCESGFFWRWMMVQHDMYRHRVVNLVKNGQLEIIGGGWVQHDEAATHYGAMIDQMTTGHRFLDIVFGRCGIPRIAWQIDPFGHSRESASLFAQMGLESLFFARNHYLDYSKRKQAKTLELNWRGSDDLGAASDILTHIFYGNSYGPPPGFCFDEYCGDQPIMDDDRFEEFNVDERVDQFLSYVQNQAKSYQTNHILLTMGSDFQYVNAGRVFANLDKLIKYVNHRQDNGTKVNVIYSTPACYTKAVKEAGIKLETKTDDFFPYASGEHSYWTGYFTSRPALKGDVRHANNLVQACQAIDAYADLGPSDSGDVNVLHQALGILQHHDAVSGTAKQHVTYDYAKMLHQGYLECEQVFNDGLGRLAMQPGNNHTLPPFHTFCFNLNSSMCNVTQEQNQFVVTFYNAMSQPLNTFARLPVGGQSYEIYDPLGFSIKQQVANTFVTNQFSAQQGPNDLSFPVTIPALGYSTYFVRKLSPEKAKPAAATKTTVSDPGDYTISNSDILVEFNSTTGLLGSVKSLMAGGIELPVTQNFFWYKGAMGSGQASGAYVFRPDGTTPFQVASGPVKLEKIVGPWVQEMRQTFAPWLTQTVRVYSGKPYVELEWTVGPIPADDQVTKEIITRFDTQIDSKGVFYTDANGRQMMKRTRNYQPTYDYYNAEPISGNYYPVNTRIAIKDDTTQLTILTDRSQGGSSIQDGSVELMVHRRCFQDDGYGVGEPLNEPGIDGRGLVIRGKHWLLFSEPSEAAHLHRHYGLEMFYQPVPMFAPYAGSFGEYTRNFRTFQSGLQDPLPPNLNFLTVSLLPRNSILVRLEHIYQSNEHSELSKPVSITIKNVLRGFYVLSLQELSLTTGQVLNATVAVDEPITLEPMQIRTFRCVGIHTLPSNAKKIQKPTGQGQAKRRRS